MTLETFRQPVSYTHLDVYKRQYYHGYCSDITRTVAVGKAKNPELYKMFDVVRKAKDAGQNSLKPGMVMGELRDIIVKVVEDAGYHIPHGPGQDVYKRQAPQIAHCFTPASAANLPVWLK